MLAKVPQEVLGFVEAFGADLAAVRTFNSLRGKGRNFFEALGDKVISQFSMSYG